MSLLFDDSLKWETTPFTYISNLCIAHGDTEIWSRREGTSPPLGRLRSDPPPSLVDKVCDKNPHHDDLCWAGRASTAANCRLSMGWNFCA